MEPENELDPNEQVKSRTDRTRLLSSDDTAQPELTEAQRIWARVTGRLLAESWLKEQEGIESN